MGLDGVEIVMAWEEAFGIEIPDAVAARLRTTTDAVDYIYSQVRTADASSCVTRRAFFVVRGALANRLTQSRRTIHPTTSVRQLLPPEDPRGAWKEIGRRVNLQYWPALPRLGEWPTVGELAQELVGRMPGAFAPSDGRWSRSEVREVVRAVIVEESGLQPTFADNALLHADLGIN